VATAAPPSGLQLAFAGIGKPWKFERALRAAGAELADFVRLADHQPYTADLLATLAGQAESWNAGLLTTEKDWVRLPAAWRDRVAMWPVRAEFEDGTQIEALLSGARP
jgi:tetraacyldisaccharide 4'-kinase